MVRYLFVFTLILLAVFSRLLPHPPNVAPITAIALFSSVYLDKKFLFIVPVTAMLISDYFLGFHSEMIWVYASFVAIGLIGLWLKNHQGILNTLGATIAGSVLFFVVTNFGVWLSPFYMYSRDLSGLIHCYIAALPFFRNTLVGDIFYVTAMFGLFEIAKKFIPKLNIQAT